MTIHASLALPGCRTTLESPPNELMSDFPRGIQELDERSINGVAQQVEYTVSWMASSLQGRSHAVNDGCSCMCSTCRASARQPFPVQRQDECTAPQLYLATFDLEQELVQEIRE